MKRTKNSRANRATNLQCPLCRQKHATPRHIEHHMALKERIKALKAIAHGYMQRVKDKRAAELPLRGSQTYRRTILT